MFPTYRKRSYNARRDSLIMRILELNKSRYHALNQFILHRILVQTLGYLQRCSQLYQARHICQQSISDKFHIYFLFDICLTINLNISTLNYFFNKP